jgi:hypothetical protein
MIGRDPNGTGLLVSTALAMNAQTPMAFAALSPESQSADGLNLYQFALGNPITGLDPSGLQADPANHLTPCYLGGAQKGPKIEMHPSDHNAFHAALTRQGWASGKNNQQLADEFWGKRPLTKSRSGVPATTKFQPEDRRRAILAALEASGFDSTDPALGREVDLSLNKADGKSKRTRGRRGGGHVSNYQDYRRKWTWERRNGTRVRVVRRGPLAKARRIAGASAIGGALVLLHLPNNAAAAYYQELIELSRKASNQRNGPTLFQEIEALIIIDDLNGELGGNIFTIYGGWDAWRSGFNLD